MQKKNTGRRGKEREKDRAGFVQRLSAALELPREIVMNIPLITIVGNDEMMIENYKRVIEYTQEKVRISTSVGVIRIEGQKLYLRRITNENIAVTGSIARVEYVI